MGIEFYNIDFKNVTDKWEINYYSIFSNIKVSIVKRVNRTIKYEMWIQFSMQGNYRWFNILQDIVKTLNSTVHRTIGMKPTDVKKKI